MVGVCQDSLVNLMLQISSYRLSVVSEVRLLSLCVNVVCMCVCERVCIYMQRPAVDVVYDLSQLSSTLTSLRQGFSQN